MRARQRRQRRAAAEIGLGRGGRDIDDAVSYSLAHRTRVEIRAILNDGERSREELARMTDQSAERVGWHVKELVADGTISAHPKRVGSVSRNYYRAVEIPPYSNEEVAAMPAEAKKGLLGVALQASLSEALAAFWAGRMAPDRHVVAAWRWFNLDAQGREALAEEQRRSSVRMQEIGAGALGRVAESGEAGRPIVVSSLTYERSRYFPSPPLVALDPVERAREVAIGLGLGERSVEEAVTYAISDILRIEILAILNECERNRYELADLIGVTPGKIKHHLKELLDEGSIELVRRKPVGNLMQHYYRAVRMPIYSAEEYAALPPESRQAIAGVVLQTLVAEALAALRAGTMAADPQCLIACRRLHADSRGREEICVEQERSWARVQEIEAEALNRVADSGEPTKSILVTLLGFERSHRSSLGGLAQGPDEAVMGGFDLGSPVQLPSNPT
jgi:DNA-binding transcriptional ArsR family regulator